MKKKQQKKPTAGPTLVETQKDLDQFITAAQQAVDLIDGCGHQPSSASTCKACADSASKVLQDALGDRF